MQLVQIHYVKRNSSNWKKFDEYSFASKNLYNHALYNIKQEYLKNGKVLRYNALEKMFRKEFENLYYALPPQTSQQILMALDRNLKSHFALLKMWKKNKKSLTGCPRFPKYKDKLNGRNILIFTNQQIRFKDGFILFPKQCNLEKIKCELTQINQVRIIPDRSRYKIEIVYTVDENKYKKGKNAAIDLGINNLMAITVEKEFCKIYNGKPLKAINQYYNKKKAILQSELRKKHDKHWSNRLERLTEKRNDKVKDYLHKASRIVVDHFKTLKVSDVVIGYNKEWKQNINLGKKTNQKFVNIPHSKLIQMITYKSKLLGINVTCNEESYTSKCSSLDKEPIEKRETYVGIRAKRGLFISKTGLKINADVNGSLNIGRKVFGDAFVPADRGFLVNPVKFLTKTIF